MGAFRSRIIKTLQSQLCEDMDIDKIQLVSNKLLLILNDYDVQERCTDIVPYDTNNDTLLKRYSSALLIEGKSVGTIKQYVRVCKKLFELLGNKLYSEITEDDIRYYLAVKLNSGLAKISLENERSYISTFFNWLYAEEFIERNPVRNIKPIKFNKTEKSPISNVNMDTLRVKCRNNKERAMIELLYSSGVRVSELLDLNINDVDFLNKTIRVRHGKGDKYRETYFTDVAASYLKKYLNERIDNNPALFLSNRKDRYSTTNSIRSIINTLSNRGNINNIHPHKFRRTFATTLTEKGMNVQDLKMLMGHSDVNTTLTYVNINKTRVRNEYNKYSL